MRVYAQRRTGTHLALSPMRVYLMFADAHGTVSLVQSVAQHSLSSHQILRMTELVHTSLHSITPEKHHTFYIATIADGTLQKLV